MNLQLARSIRINVTVGKVFHAWTHGDHVAAWFAPMAVERPRVSWDFRVGGAYEIETNLGGGHVHTTRGEFVEIEPDQRIVMTWCCDAFEDRVTRVTVTFREEGAATLVEVVHEGFELEVTRDKHAHGWQACFAGLTEFLEMRETRKDGGPKR